MRTSLVVGAVLLGVGAVLVSACVKGDECDFGGCSGPTADGGNDGPSSDAPGIDAPPGCDLTKDPSESTACVDDLVGVFVDGTSGDDGNPGTKASPVKSITTALTKLAGKARVYVCAGTYPEHVKLTTAVSIYGGFACGAWKPDGTKASVAPADAGYALAVSNVTGAITVSDLALTSVAGTAVARSSIAAFVTGSPSVLLQRLKLSAGQGFDGAPGADATVGIPTPADLSGNAPQAGAAGMGGGEKACTCSTGGTSKGGRGGDTTGLNNDGKAGETAMATPEPANADGAGQTSLICLTPGGAAAHPGSAAPPAKSALAPVIGSLDADGWKAGDGLAGDNGVPGQGGGGAGGNPGGASPGGGGGGGCGGCGGSGGGGGTAGGSSVALMLLSSPVKVVGSELTSAAGGKGGAGKQGAGGRFGGVGGARAGSCQGAAGGTGGTGGGGSGGAGGLSVGILYKNGAPNLETSPVTTGAFGAKGIGGATPTNDGPDGQKAESLEIQ